MRKNDAMIIVKIIVIIAIIFGAISFLLPWRGYSYSYTYSGMSMSAGVDYYNWGGHFYMDFPSSIYSPYGSSFDIWSFFYIFEVGAPEGFTESTSSSTIIYQEAILATAVIISFAFGIITIISGIAGIKIKNACLFAGISSLISIIALVVGFEATFASTPQGSTASGMIPYTFGFYLMIIAMIFLFLGYVLHHYLPIIIMATTQQQSYSGYTPPHPPSDISYRDKTPYERKTCPACGAPIERKTTFCLNCGKELK